MPSGLLENAEVLDVPVVGLVLSWFVTRADKPPIQDPARVRRIYEWRRWSVFLSLLIGYSFFYVCRLSISVIKKPLIDEGILNADQLGKIGSAFFITYAFSKLLNGFLADRANVGRFMATGLLGSAVFVFLLGFHTFFFYLTLIPWAAYQWMRTSLGGADTGVAWTPLLGSLVALLSINVYYFAFLGMWTVHGWAQSTGSAPCGASLSQWFSNRERGTRYGIWSTSHSIGEGLSFAITSTVVAYFGWRYGLWGAGAVSLVVALILYKTLADRPQTYGLPSIADYHNDHAGAAESAKVSVGRAQLEVLKNPYVWILGLASMTTYVARYGVNSWGMLYLQETKQYTIISAGLVLSVAKFSETIGTLLCGIISDRFFNANRNVTTLIYGILMITGLSIFWAAPGTLVCELDTGHAQYLKAGAVDAQFAAAIAQQGGNLGDGATMAAVEGEKVPVWQMRRSFLGIRMNWYQAVVHPDRISIIKAYDVIQVLGSMCYAFGIGGLIAFLGGLTAIDICSKKAAGAAMGVVGMFSYIGASIQERVSGALLQAGVHTGADGVIAHEFNPALTFWLGSAITSVLLSCLVWKAKARD